MKQKTAHKKPVYFDIGVLVLTLRIGLWVMVSETQLGPTITGSQFCIKAKHKPITGLWVMVSETQLGPTITGRQFCIKVEHKPITGLWVIVVYAGDVTRPTAGIQDGEAPSYSVVVAFGRLSFPQQAEPGPGVFALSC